MKTIHLGGRMHELAENICLLKADLNYTHIYFTDGSHKLVATTLGILEKRLPEYFFRINRSTVIRMDGIQTTASSSQVISKGFGYLKISRRRKEAFLEQYKQFQQS